MSFLNSSVPLSNISNDNKQSISSNNQTTAKLLNSKQILHYEMQRNTFKHKIDFELRDLFQQCSKIIDYRAKRLQFIE